MPLLFIVSFRVIQLLYSKQPTDAYDSCPTTA